MRITFSLVLVLCLLSTVASAQRRDFATVQKYHHPPFPTEVTRVKYANGKYFPLPIPISDATRKQINDPKEPVNGMAEFELAREVSKYFDPALRSVYGKEARITYKIDSQISENKKLKDSPKISVYLRVKVHHSALEATINVLLYEKLNTISRGNITRQNALNRYAKENQEKFDKRNAALGLKQVRFFYDIDDMMITRSRKNRWWTWYSKDYKTEVTVYGPYAAERALQLHKAMKHFMLYEMSDRIMRAKLPYLTDAQDQLLAQKMVNTLKKYRRERLTGFYYERLADIGKMIYYLKDEDGVVKPIRTGHELQLYNNIKSHYAKHGTSQPLDIYNILEMSLEVTPLDKGSKINLFTTLLTAHNVMRILARPDQWSPSFTNTKKEKNYYGHHKEDPVYPIMLDILGLQSSDHQKMLPDMVMKKYIRDPDTKAIQQTGWANVLFKKDGFFVMQSPARTGKNDYTISHFNAGCHYYFWIGINFYPIWGKWGVRGGGLYESSLKSTMGEFQRASVQMDYLLGAVTSGAAIWEYVYPPK